MKTLITETRSELITKICSVCNTEKSSDAFYKNSLGRNGKMSWCKECHKTWSKSHFIKNREHINKVHKTWVANNLDRRRVMGRNCYHRRKNFWIEKRHRLPKGTITLWLETQNNKCPCCQRDFTRSVKPHVHHCHHTGYVFGMWCQECNLMEGIVKKIGDFSVLLTLHKLMIKHELFYYGSDAQINN